MTSQEYLDLLNKAYAAIDGLWHEFPSGASKQTLGNAKTLIGHAIGLQEKILIRDNDR